MSKIEDNSKIEKPKVSALIMATVSAGILGVSILFARANFHRPWWSEYVTRNLELLFGMTGVIAGYWSVKKTYGRKAYFTLGIILLFLLLPVLLILILLFSAYVFSSVDGWIIWACIILISIACLICLLIYPAINSMDRWVFGIKSGTFKSDIFVYSGIATGLFLSGIWLAETCKPVSTEVGMGCSLNLKKLGNTISIYQKDNHGKYPEPNIWCDLLLNSGQVDKDDFICPEVKFRWNRQFLPFPIPINRKSYYAINPNCEPNSPPHTVLLFEIEGGWNKSGGPKLLSMKNHHGSLCHVLLNNGNIERIYNTKLEYEYWNMENLYWNTEEKK